MAAVIDAPDTAAPALEIEIAVGAGAPPSSPAYVSPIHSMKKSGVASVMDSYSTKGKDLRWNNVNFSVGEKKILVNCCGIVPSGKLCAVMGASGSGKTTLLNVLSGRSTTRDNIKVSGEVYVGGNQIDPALNRQSVAYCMQDDALISTATPKEVLTFSARLRLPKVTTEAEIESLVTMLLEELGITDCADVFVGGEMVKGISGGQRKRTSVAVELITRPNLLFLDEPTSGLDTFSAFNLCETLKKVARGNGTVLCTIHQPSSEIFFTFDSLILLKEGRVMYDGPTSGVTEKFKASGFLCPRNYNPADYVMAISQVETLASLQKTGLLTDQSVVVVSAPEAGLLTENGAISVAKSVIDVKADFWTQLHLLAVRELQYVRRNVAMTGARFGVTIFLSVLFGVVFENAGGRDDGDPTNLVAHQGAITMITISNMFGAANPIMLAFPSERPMFMREYSTGTYSSSAYFLSKTLIELPLALLQTVLTFLIVYWLCDFQGSFILIVLASWGISLAASSIALVVGCVVANAATAAEMAPAIFVPQILFAGFFVRTEQIPVWLRWSQWLCGIKYTLNLILIVEFDPALDSCQGAAAPNCASVLTTNSIERDDWWIYALVLFMLFAINRVVAACLLQYRTKNFY